VAKKEAAREAALEKSARTLQLKPGQKQVRVGMGKRLHALIRRNKDGSTRRYWVCRFAIAGTLRVREMSFGAVELSTLAAVRQRVLDEIAKPLNEGVADPIAKTKADAEAGRGPPTFGEVFADYVRAHRATWSNEAKMNVAPKNLNGMPSCKGSSTGSESIR
jgi:hypothetical protein